MRAPSYRLVVTVLVVATLIATPSFAQPRFIDLPGATSGLPFSAAVEAGDFVCLSGALGFLPGSASLAEGAEAQAERTLDNLDAVLAAAGVERSRVVDARLYLADRAWYPALDAAIARRFPERPPATTAVEVNRASMKTPGPGGFAIPTDIHPPPGPDEGRCHWSRPSGDPASTAPWPLGQVC